MQDYTEQLDTLIEYQETIISNQKIIIERQEMLNETLNISLIYVVVIAFLISSDMIHHLFDSVWKRK